MNPRNREPKKGTGKPEEVARAQDAGTKRRFKNNLFQIDPKEAVGIIQNHLKYVDRTHFLSGLTRAEISPDCLSGLRLDEDVGEARVCIAVEALPQVDWRTGELLENLSKVAQSNPLKEAIAKKLGQWPRDMSALHAAAANYAKENGFPGIGDKAKEQDQVRFPFSQPGLALFIRPAVSGGRKVFDDPDAQGFDVTAGIAASRSKDQNAQTFKFEKLPYHDELGDVYPGTGRTVAGIFADNRGSVALRIRTTDTQTDVAGLVELLKTNDCIELVPLKPVKKGSPPDIHKMQEEEETQEGDIGYPKVCVVLRKTHGGNYYEVSAKKVSKESMDDAMALVDKVGRHLFEEKEIQQYPNSSALQCARALSKAQS